ncbi:MAG: DUF4127 family protein [Peptococcaceae bacterium]|nr:DUF4127 family protein [Peptococcaceae bacterium]
MHKLRSLFLLILCLILPLSTLSGCALNDEPPTIALVPLDSRPCNTQYPQLLAQTEAATLLLPPEEDMDHFLDNADSEALWAWLENAADTADDLVIFTNSLFCGGLIASRSSGAYDDIEDDLTRLEALCTAFKKDNHHSITVIQVLPRLTPNQFDDELYPYVDALTAYGEAWDKADAAGNAAPTVAANVPANALEEYRALHEKSADLAESLNNLAGEGLIDHLIISQDDGDVNCPANITFRHLASNKADNTSLIHGADELAMLLVSDLAAADLEAPSVQVLYSDEGDKDQCYPYESITLEEMTEQKLILSGLQTGSDDTTATLYLHTGSEDLNKTQEAIDNHDGLFALADVASTNQADPALVDTLMTSDSFDNIDAYAGWNTAGNSIGTVCATLRAIGALDARWGGLSDNEKNDAILALYRFRAVRLGEDVCYMAAMRDALQSDFLSAGLSDHTSAFTSDAAWQKANALLSKAYAPYNQQLTTLFDGTHTLSLGNHHLQITISDFDSSATFPWARSFEVKITPTMTVQNVSS